MVNSMQREPLLTVKDVAFRLKISRQTIWVLRREGKLTAVPVGDCVRFTEEEIQRFINASSEPKSCGGEVSNSEIRL